MIVIAEVNTSRYLAIIERALTKFTADGWVKPEWLVKVRERIESERHTKVKS